MDPSTIGGDPPSDIPPEAMARIVRAIDRSPSTVVVLLDHDLRIEWISQSVMWATGSDPDARVGSSALQRIHHEDIDRLLDGIGQLAARGGTQLGATDPIRYRFQRFDGSWVVMEATVHNLLDDPYVDGMLVFTRPLTGDSTPVSHALDLLVAGMPFTDVLAACAGLVPASVGSAAAVALMDGDVVVGAPVGSQAERFAVDHRWWADSVQRQDSLWPSDFDRLPHELVGAARRAGFCTAWTVAIRERATREMVGCLVVWVNRGVERNIAIDESIRRAERLASLVIAEERRRLSVDGWSNPVRRHD